VKRGLAVAALLLAIALVAVVLAWDRGEGGPAGDDAGWVEVDQVVDGDTIVLADGTRVRLVQIDAPERGSAAECFGDEARAAARRLLPEGTSVRLERDPATDDRDDFDRLLRYAVRRDGTNVNLRLVADGAAAPYFYGGTRGRHAGELERSAREARTARRGLWGACPGTPLEPGRGVATGSPR
jgi:micrococcal nuclease